MSSSSLLTGSSSSLLAQGLIQSSLESQSIGGIEPSQHQQNKRKRHVKHAVQSPTVDLESYIANYSPTVPKSNYRDKVSRLLFIAEVCPTLKMDALRLALQDVRENSLDWHRYVDIQRLINSDHDINAGSGNGGDLWAQQTELACKATVEKLEAEMQLFRNSLIKESVRMGLLELGEHHWTSGDVESAFKTILKMRDYCTTAKHHLEMYLLLMRLSLDMQNYSNVVNYANKAKQAQQTYSKSLESNSSGRGSSGNLASSLEVQSLMANSSVDIQSALALGYLDTERFSEVVSVLVESPFVAERVISNTTILANNSDIATLICLCGLASFDRSQIKDLLMTNSNVLSYLEDETNLRELVEAFQQAEYGKMLDIIDRRLLQNLYLDMHFHHHVDTLIVAIKRRAMLQYCVPFRRIDMSLMARVFRTNLSQLEADVVQLITRHDLKFRIDQSQLMLEFNESNSVEELESKVGGLVGKTIAYGKNALLKQQLNILDIKVKNEA